MSGHSKWATTKRAKGAADAKRGLLFSKLSKRISIAVREGGGGDVESNFKLRLAVEKAREASMPNDNIERAIKKGLGEGGGQAIEEVVYEGYGPFGTAFIIEAATDNKNRTVSSIKHLLSKHGGNLGAAGSVSWQFTTKGQILVERTANLDELELVAIDAGAEDVVESEEGLAVYTRPEELDAVKKTLAAAGATIVAAEVIQESNQPMELSDEEKIKVETLYSELESDEDVIGVHTNATL